MMEIKIPTISCRYCGCVLLILWAKIGVAEYFEKVVLHEADCAKTVAVRRKTDEPQ